MDSGNFLRQLLMIGVGTTSLVAERLKQVTETWVREGRFDPDQARNLVDEVMAQLNINNAGLEDQFHRLLRHTLQDLGVPRPRSPRAPAARSGKQGLEVRISYPQARLGWARWSRVGLLSGGDLRSGASDYDGTAIWRGIYPWAIGLLLGA
jgi:polyhydroxyalkanoate synthesis regulator phasin